MYTVKELIETLKQCPEDYEIILHGLDMEFAVEVLGINHDTKTVDLFGE